MLDEFPTDLTPHLPHFTVHGVLPLGDYGPNQARFEATFVQTGNRRARQAIYEGWQQHREALLRHNLTESARQLLNGSFTTTKTAPGDLDLAVEVPVDGDYIAQIQGVLAPLFGLLQGPATKAQYRCDAYPILSLPREHPDHDQVTKGAIRYWTKWFGKTRAGIPKGRIWATVGGLL